MLSGRDIMGWPTYPTAATSAGSVRTRSRIISCVGVRDNQKNELLSGTPNTLSHCSLPIQVIKNGTEPSLFSSFCRSRFRDLGQHV